MTGKLYLGLRGSVFRFEGGLLFRFWGGGGSPTDSVRVKAGRSRCEEPAFPAAGEAALGRVMGQFEAGPGSAATSRSRGRAAEPVFLPAALVIFGPPGIDGC